MGAGRDHTFGGPFAGLFEFEIDAGGFGGDTGGLPAGDVAGSGAPAGETPVPAGEPAPQYATLEHFQTLEQSLGQIQQMLQGFSPASPAAPEPAAAPEFTYDPFDPQSVQNAVQGLLSGELERFAREQLGPVNTIVGHFAQQQAEQLARETLEGLQKELGEFDVPGAVRIAEGMILSDENLDEQVAFKQAATMIRDLEQRAEARGAEKAKAQWANLAQGSLMSEPPGAGAASPGEETPTGTGKYEQVLSRYRQAQAVRTPVA